MGPPSNQGDPGWKWALARGGPTRSRVGLSSHRSLSCARESEHESSFHHSIYPTKALGALVIGIATASRRLCPSIPAAQSLTSRKGPLAGREQTHVFNLEHLSLLAKRSRREPELGHLPAELVAEGAAMLPYDFRTSCSPRNYTSSVCCGRKCRICQPLVL